jgi:hypothetical protein
MCCFLRPRSRARPRSVLRRDCAEPLIKQRAHLRRSVFVGRYRHEPVDIGTLRHAL